MGLLEALALVSLEHGDPSLAADYQLRALQIADSVVGRKHFLAANYLIALGDIRAADGDLMDVRALYEEALEILESTLGQDHNYIADCLESLSKLHRRLGNFQEGAELAARAVRIRRMVLREFSLVVSERDALISSREMHRSMSDFLSACLDAKGSSGQTDTAIVDIILAGKGEISDAIFDRRSVLNQPMDSAAADAWQSYRLALYQLSELYVEGPELADDEGYRNAIDSLSRVVKQREALFAQRMERYNDHSQQDQVDHSKVAPQLPPKSTLVEYIRYVRYSADASHSGTPSYIAITLDSDGKVSLADLGAAGPIDDAVQRYRQHFAAIAVSGHLPSLDEMAQYETIARELCTYLWTPIQDEISARDLIFVAPDGPLNRISFATLIDDDGHYLLDRYPIHYLSAGRDLLRLKASSAPASGLLAVGDPAFATPPELGGNTTTQIPWVGSVRSSCEELQDLKLGPLPNTRTEVNRVVALWEAAIPESLDTLLGINATEDRFKQSAHGKRVIHLSTHGYYLQGVCAGNEPEHRSVGEEEFITEDPLLQSGLFFAGCMDPKKEPGTTTSKLEDGVLTAAEIAGMDLSGTQLVVLSACETGLGRLYQGEGVYGLRRAFQIAGARTVISTLWQIADEFTAPMLPPIYRLSRDLLPNRLRATQLDWITTLRQNGLSDHPYSWGAFIAQGDWR
jgi:CHAT domain-containing protein